MLVLTRKVGQKIMLDNGVEFTVTMVRGRCVQIGISAPDDVKILRGEIAPKPPQGPSNCRVDGTGPELMPDSGLPIV